MWQHCTKKAVELWSALSPLCCVNMKRALDTCSSVSKKSKVVQKFRDSYTKEWPCLVTSKMSENHVYCEVCSCDFVIAHGGRDDCRRHIESKKHQDYGKVQSVHKPISSFFVSKGENETTKAELLFTSFLVEHNIPLAVSDHAAHLFRAMFPDSAIAKKYGCARTKTSALVQHMSDQTKEEIACVLRISSFSLSTDGSTDNNAVKLYPVVVSFFNEKLGKVCTLLLSLLECTDNTGQGIFSVIDKEFISLGISWDNCIAFSSDNANTMIGVNKGVFSFCNTKNPSMILQGCSCHLIHLAAQKASSQLCVNIEQFLVQIFYFLEKSSKRLNTLKVYQELCGTKSHKILKCVSTRWLSLLECVQRILEQWDPLKLLFCEPDSQLHATTTQFQNIKSLMLNPLTKLFCLFLESTLPIFNAVNVFLQQEAPVIHKLRRKLEDLLKDLLVRFVKPSALQLGSTSVTDVNFKKRKHQKDDADLVVGSKCRSQLKDCTNKVDVQKFYSSVRDFYVTACSYILNKFPLNDEFLQHVEICDISRRTSVSFSSVQYFIERFPQIISVSELDVLEQEFALYQCEGFPVDIISEARMDVSWWKISNVKNESGQLKFKFLPKIMLALLTVPHSNAYTERIFSSVRRNHTEFRAAMSTKTLGALMTEKVKTNAYSEVCYEKKFTTKELNDAKHATMRFLSKDK